MSEIRVVDFSSVSNSSLENNLDEDMKKVSKEIVESFEEIGFVYIKNHGIPQKTIDNLFKMSEAFFSLPLEVKRKYKRNDFYSSGYVESSREIFNKADHIAELRESFDSLRNVGDKGVQNKIEGFDQNILQMIEDGSKFFDKLLRCLEYGLDLPFGTLLDKHTNLASKTNESDLRMINYPPIPFDIPEKCVRCGTHTDYGTITILFQDNMGGLEVQNRNKEWVNADPIPGTILLNVADILQKFTSGRLVATPHRVLVPEDERRKKCSRKSCAYFLIPNDDVIIKPFDAPDDDSSTYMTSHDYLHLRYNDTFTY